MHTSANHATGLATPHCRRTLDGSWLAFLCPNFVLFSIHRWNHRHLEYIEKFLLPHDIQLKSHTTRNLEVFVWPMPDASSGGHLLLEGDNARGLETRGTALSPGDLAPFFRSDHIEDQVVHRGTSRGRSARTRGHKKPSSGWRAHTCRHWDIRQGCPITLHRGESHWTSSCSAAEILHVDATNNSDVVIDAVFDRYALP